MITGENIYQTIKSEMLELPDLADDTLRELLGHLGRKGKINGTAGRVWGEALAEAALRFMRQRQRERRPATADDSLSPLTDFITTDPDQA